MTQIQILEERCTGCGTCLTRCPACFTDSDGLPTIRDDGARCIGCGHCVALCPGEAVFHEGFRSEPLESVQPPPLDLAAFDQLVKQRRSHRHFRDEPIPDEVLSRILDTARFSPSGVHARSVCVRVVRRKARIRELSGTAVGYFTKLTTSLDEQSLSFAASGRPVPPELERAVSCNARYRTMGKSFERGLDPIFHKAGAVLVFHADRNAPTPKDDCLIAAQTAVIAAECLCLGTCYIGLFNRAFENDESVRHALALPTEHSVYATLILGYPALKFLRVPYRAPFPTVWE